MPPRTIVLTGASRGLGRAMLAGFIAAGHRVAACARSAKGIAELAREYPEHRFDQVDVADEPAVRQWAAAVLASHGPPDLLVNNAAVINENAVLWQAPPAEFDRVVDVNVKGTFYVCRHFLPAMVENGRGVVVNFSSGWGRGTSPEVAPYCATKFAVEGLTKALAAELPRGMAAIPLNPGIIDTDMLKSCFGAEAASYPAPNEWAARAVPFILSLGAKQNGESLSVE